MPVEPKKGVEFNPPPLTMLPSIKTAIDSAMATLPRDKNGMILALATDKGVNAAFVVRVNDDWKVVSWVGKTWGSEFYGGAGFEVTF